MHNWTSCDDRVRGGKSTSYLVIKSSTADASTDRSEPDKAQAHDQNQNRARNETSDMTVSVLFYGHLDVNALGVAGFASQRNTTDTQKWNLIDYDGIELRIGKSDGKRYVLPSCFNAGGCRFFVW